MPVPFARRGHPVWAAGLGFVGHRQMPESGRNERAWQVRRNRTGTEAGATGRKALVAHDRYLKGGRPGGARIREISNIFG